MKYIKTDTEYEPKITGSPNGVYSVEIKEKKSFKSKGERNYFNEFVKKNNEDIRRVYEQNFVKIDNKRITEIIYFPSYKKAKNIDVVQYRPFQMGFQLLISEKAYEILKKYRIPAYNIIPSKIETFDKKYFMIGFSMIENKNIDFNKSKFYDFKLEKEIVYKNNNDYAEINFSRYPLETYLKERYNYDIINLQGEGIYFSEDLITALEKNGIIGFVRKKSILYNETE
ncbi:hypothetical protein [Maribacter luteus]|uniref:Uncharacterized protein n=1 Tax=Maribacter luteus TaxID=2594478 RepID=A0A6I2MRA1_9FLAO|nr:hypothetical protein [Maribacter luteus]MRX64714.1 hypothetical protein [Maribacter luteus]